MLTTRKLIRLAPRLVFVLLVCGLVLAHKLDVARILVVHSYQTDYDWVVKIDQGIERIREDYPDVTWRFHYMDLKNHPKRKAEAARTALDVVDAWDPAVIVLFDDVAQDLVGRPLASAGHRVVFGGVNGDPDKYYKHAEHVYGIRERKPLAAIRDTLANLALACADCGRRVQFIGDASASIAKEVSSYAHGYDGTFDWAPLEWMPHRLVKTFDEWKETVSGLGSGSRADLLLITNYRQLRASDDEDAPFVDAVEVMRWTQRCSPVPVLGMGWTNAEDGARLAVATSPFEQGEHAAKVAAELASGNEWPGERIRDGYQFVVSMRAPVSGEPTVSEAAYAAFGERFPLYRAFAEAADNFHATALPASSRPVCSGPTMASGGSSGHAVR